MRSILQLAVVVWVVTGIAQPLAFGGNPLARPAAQQAREHLDRGNKLYNVGSFDEAITEYKAGALIEQAPVFDYNLGQANRQLGRYRDALWHYDRFLNNAQPSGELHDAVIAFMAEMRAQLANKALTMPPTDPAPPSTSTARSTNEHNLDRGPTATATLPEQKQARDWLGLSVTASGVIGLGTATYLFLRASSLNDQAAHEQRQLQRSQLRDAVHTRVVVGAIAASGGAALIIAGIVKVALHRDEPARAAAWSIAPTSEGVAVFGWF